MIGDEGRMYIMVHKVALLWEMRTWVWFDVVD